MTQITGKSARTINKKKIGRKPKRKVSNNVIPRKNQNTLPNIKIERDLSPVSLDEPTTADSIPESVVSTTTPQLTAATIPNDIRAAIKVTDRETGQEPDQSTATNDDILLTIKKEVYIVSNKFEKMLIFHLDQINFFFFHFIIRLKIHNLFYLIQRNRHGLLLTNGRYPR